MCAWGSITQGRRGGEYRPSETHRGGHLPVAFPQVGPACSVSHQPDNVGGASRGGSGASAHSAVGESASGNNCAPFYTCPPCLLASPQNPLPTSKLGGCLSKFTAAPRLGFFLSLWATPHLSQKMRRGHGGSALPPGAGIPSPKEKNAQRLYVFASRGAGSWGPQGQDLGG